MSGYNRLNHSLRLYYLKRNNRFEAGIGAEMPEAYKKFWREWKLQKPTAVHYIEKPGRYERNETTGEVYPIQNVPIPVKYPSEHNEGIWGGEGIVQGFQKRHPMKRRVPHFWFPTLKRSILYSEVLDKYMRIVVTDRTMDLIHENYGFDHYLLKTPACDLKSELALKLKKEMLKTLHEKSLYPDDPVKREEIYTKYQAYLEPYTAEDIEWYGLNWIEASKKMLAIQAESKVFVPLKHQYRENLIKQLKENTEEEDETQETSGSWFSKINPLSKNTKNT